MNKNEELAKLLGIEPKCLDNTFSGCKYANDDTRKCCFRYKNKSCEFKEDGYYLYPDFTEPSNFLLLWEMSDENDRKQFIDLLIEFMKNNTYQDIDDYYRENYQKAEEYKQQAQQTEWNY